MSSNIAQWVDPFLGTSSRPETEFFLHHGNTHPGALVPWGMASVCPANVDITCQGEAKPGAPVAYRHGLPKLFGFTHQNLSGVGGLGDWGALLLTPIAGELSLDAQRNASAYGEEKAHPGYYRVRLFPSSIVAEATATERVGVTRFTLPAGTNHVVLNLRAGLSSIKGATLRQVSPTEFTGMRMLGGFCWSFYARTPLFFCLRLEDVPEESGLWEEGVATECARLVVGDAVGAFATYRNAEPRQITVKVGISYTSEENARANLDAEAGERDFDTLVAEATEKWEQALSRVRVRGGTEEQKTMFYTALYHCLIHPSLLSDGNGDYPAMVQREVRKAAHNKIEVRSSAYERKTLRSDFPRYTVFSLWDTYRTLHPLLCLLYPQQQNDMVRSMLGMFQESGCLPKWELAGNETYIMVGDPGAIVVADTWMRGVRKFDPDLAWEALQASAHLLADGSNPLTRPGLRSYLRYGFIPQDDKGTDWVWGSVATTLEYAVADFAIAQFARETGRMAPHEEFLRRSHAYRLLMDKDCVFMRPRLANGEWFEPFDPLARHGEWDTASAIGGPGFVEENAWCYAFFVPHDIPGLIEQVGEARFVEQLNACFDGNHFNAANEPDLTYPYAYNHIIGQEHQAGQRVRHIVEQFYRTGPDGLPGNDDAGTLSAWLIFSLIGLYPEAPGRPDYSLIPPAFDEVVLSLDPVFYSGKTVQIIRTGSAAPEARIASITWNGGEIHSPFLPHAEITQGGTLHFALKK